MSLNAPGIGGAYHQYEIWPVNPKHNTPDFFLIYEDTLIEIKPEKMQENDVVLKKFETLKAVFENKKCKLMGFSDIAFYIQKAINIERINLYLGYELIMNEKQLQRLQKNYGDILRATKGI